jgi:catechol 2,3-dioxygenase-like lactoylglutathione lyase family enzyme
MITDIDHIQLAMPAGKEALARDFYGRVLGLKEIEKPDDLKRRGGVWFAVGPKQLHLGVQQDFIPATKAHPAFNVADLKKLRAVLIEAGHPVIDDEKLPGYDRFYSADPFGNRLEFLRKA